MVTVRRFVDLATLDLDYRLSRATLPMLGLPGPGTSVTANGGIGCPFAALALKSGSLFDKKIKGRRRRSL
jgi:hypothetical protein